MNPRHNTTPKWTIIDVGERILSFQDSACVLPQIGGNVDWKGLNSNRQSMSCVVWVLFNNLEHMFIIYYRRLPYS
ncbi:hypothetical protein NPIL_75351, partial [Nephila pilipes]